MILTILTKLLSLTVVITLTFTPTEAKNFSNLQLTQIPSKKSTNTIQATPTPTSTSQASYIQTKSDSTFGQAVFTFLGVVLGAALTAAASAYSARQKIKEVEITYIQKIRENYLANARLYTDEVYVPISIALSKLSTQYLQFRNHIDFDTQTADKQVAEVFCQACQEYNKKILILTERGVDAFLTTELENRLRSFTNFIQTSLTADKVIVKYVMRYRLNMPFFPFLNKNSILAEQQGERVAKIIEKQESQVSVKNQHRNFIGFFKNITDVLTTPINLSEVDFSKVDFDFLGIGFTYEVKEIVAAPISSREFERRIISDVTSLKFLIKEVTLGSHTNP